MNEGGYNMKILFDGNENKSLDLLINECIINNEFKEYLLNVTNEFAKMLNESRQIKYVTLEFGIWKLIDFDLDNLVALNNYIYNNCTATVNGGGFYNAKNC